MSPTPARRAGAALAVALSAGCALGVGCGSGANDPDASSTATPFGSASDSAMIEAPPRCLANRAPAFQPAGVRGASSSSIDLVRAGDRTLALIADPDERALHVVDTKSMVQVGVTPLDGRPQHVVALEDGRIMVTLHEPAGLVALEPADTAFEKPFEVRCDADVGNDPVAIAHDAKRVYVTSGFDAALVVLGAADLETTAAVRLAREPRGVVVEGALALVTHAVGGEMSVVDLGNLAVPPARMPLTVGRPKAPEVDESKPPAEIAQRRTGQGYALATLVGPREDGSRGTLRLFAPHTVSDTGPATSARTRGYGGGGVARTVAPFVAAVDPVAKRMITSDAFAPLSSEAPDACILPRGVALHEDSLFVACLDADVVIELDARVADPMSIVRRTYRSPQPSGVALDGVGGLFVHSTMSRTLTRHATSVGASQEPAEIVLWRRAGVARDDVWLRGRALFHASRDARIGAGHACASCHPDGRDDGLVWSSPDGARQTPVLAGRVEGSAPYGWFGENATLRAHLDHTFTRLGGTGFDSGEASAADVAALAKYVGSLALPVRSELMLHRASVERGKDVYVAYGCQGCHPDGKSDGKAHDVGSGTAGERRATFDTPWLLGVRASAPYFHDGRYATLEDLLTSKDSRMFSGTLSVPDRKALMAYLESL